MLLTCVDLGQNRCTEAIRTLGTQTPDRINGPISCASKILNSVLSSVAEAELAGGFIGIINTRFDTPSASA
jgi:hypothetical protein